MLVYKCLVLCLALFLLPALPCSPPLQAAALQRKDEILTPDRAWNPHPDADDLTLPMPCGGQMVFRAVAVPGKNLLYDKKFTMGVHVLSDPEREKYERTRDGYISGPFTQQDLPVRWRENLNIQNAGNFYYYFMAKYEVSLWQWSAIMEGAAGGACPTAPITREMAEPVSGKTWFEIQEFMQNYMSWLLQNSKDSLPVFKGNDKDIAYLRLPTEEEWEFAAKGGLNVPEEIRNQEDFHPLDGLEKADFGIFSTQARILDEPSAIGSRHPNPLKIYDMAGNVKELVQSLFHFSIPDMGDNGKIIVHRPHGSPGGLVAKGGGFRSQEEDILPGKREEVALFNESGPVKTRELGFRPALGGINTPASAERMEKLLTAGLLLKEKKYPPDRNIPSTPAEQDNAVKIDTKGALSAELEKIIRSTSSPLVRQNLEQYRRMVVDYENAVERREDAEILNGLRSLLHHIEGQRNAGARFGYLNLIMRQPGADDPTVTARNRQSMRDWKLVLNNMTNSYKEGLANILKKTGGRDFTPYFAQLHKEYASDDLYSKHMQQNLTALQKHIRQIREWGTDKLSRENIWKDVFQDVMFKTVMEAK
jgi:hypothetical protein